MINSRRNLKKQPRNPLLKRLRHEQSLLSTEVRELNRDLLIISELLKRKEHDLEAVNRTLIQKTLRGPFLSVVDNDRLSVTEANSAALSRKEAGENTQAKSVTFTCLDGGLTAF